MAARLCVIAETAGRLVLAAREAGCAVREKADGSPVSEADLRAEDAIAAALARDFPGIPIVSEECAPPERADPDAAFFLVDPLDGTAEFIAGGPEFCVNIALIAGGRPIAGALHAPALGMSWFGGESARKARLSAGGGRRVAAIHARPAPTRGLVALVSRRHGDTATEALLARMPIARRKVVSAAIKFAVLAEGKADVYPRLGLTMAWDTAAGQAILEAAGGCVLDARGEPLRYRCETGGFANGGFCGWGDPAAAGGFPGW